MPAPNVVGLFEIAAHFGVSRTYATELSKRHDFPLGTKLKMGWVWDARDVERWIGRHPEVGRKARGES